jgi:hypothetical protein
LILKKFLYAYLAVAFFLGWMGQYFWRTKELEQEREKIIHSFTTLYDCKIMFNTEKGNAEVYKYLPHP